MAFPDVQVMPGSTTTSIVRSLNNFRRNSSALLPKHEDWLDNTAAHYLKTGVYRRVELWGHTDRTGTDEVNMEVARARVNAVRQRLIDKGVSPSQITHAQAMGERAWAAQGVPDDTENPGMRRVHVHLHY